MSSSLDISAPRRNAILLSISHAFAACVAPILVATGGLAGLMLLGDDKSLATAPVTGYNVGVALGALPAARLMALVGRRYGFISGALVSALGAFLACHSVLTWNFFLFCFGLTLYGVGHAFTQQYRFAATDDCPDFYKPKAISFVLVGGMFAAILGTQTVIHFRGWLSVEFAGAYLIGGLLVLVAFLFLWFLVFSSPSHSDSSDSPESSSYDFLVRPRFVVSVLCGTSAYGLMAFVMTGAPLAMVGHGHSIESSTHGIMLHVIAMFAPSLVTGHLIVRFGKERIVATGMVMLGLCAILALSGLTVAHFWVSLILLGVGWNFGFIGSTAMLTDSYEPNQQSKAQGTNDFVLFGCVALASLMSGFVYNIYGWWLINWIVLPVTVICLLALFLLRRYEQPKTAST